MSRKVINVVASKNQFTTLNLSSIVPKIEQFLESEEREIELTEEEVLQIYGVESLSEINNVNFALGFTSIENPEIPGLVMSNFFVILNSIVYNSSVVVPEQPLTLFRVYNFFKINGVLGDSSSLALIISIPKDGIEETDDIRTRFLLQKD